jgi:hypothetical protein
MNEITLLVLVFPLLAGCSYRKQQFKSAFHFQQNLYGEFYRAGLLGNMSSLYLTDSATFRQYLGTYDDEQELIYARFSGDSIIVSQRRTDTLNQRERPTITTYSLKALKAQGNFE